MRIGFVDLSAFDYTPLSPERVPLGGMQSGLSYLARSLARRGHEVRLYNRTGSEGPYDGVLCLNAGRLSQPGFRAEDCDAYVSISCDGRYLRSILRGPPLALFTGHNTDEPTMQVLADPAERRCWDAFVFKTNWHALAFRDRFAVDERRIAILTNAASPFFHARPARERYFFEEDRGPVLYFSSTPHRGLDLLAAAFPLIRAELPRARCRIFSSMAVYQKLGARDEYLPLYDACRRLGLDYVGSLPQPRLAEEIASADILAFPSTYPETSCITLMEAMLNGSVIVSHDLGALPETAAGFGHFLPYDPAGEGNGAARRFADFLVAIVGRYRRTPGAGRRRLESQRAYAHENYSWERKAEEWEAFLAGLLTRGGGAAGGAGLNYCALTRTGRRIYVDPADARAQRLVRSGGNFNPPTLLMWRWLLRREAWDLVIDVGANYGEMLMNGDLPGGARILAVEPSPGVLPYLRRTLRGLANVEIIEAAVSDSVGRSGFRVDGAWSGMSRLATGAEAGEEVPTTTLEALVVSRCGEDLGRAAVLVKLDIEGGEGRALRGLMPILGAVAKFACLVEIAHLADEDWDHLFAVFRVFALDLTMLRFVELRDRRAFREGAARLWSEDAVLLRRSDGVAALDGP